MTAFSTAGDPTIKIKDAGESALLLELEATIDPVVNARAIAAADAVRRAALRGVRDVISTYRSVAIHFDPLDADVDAVRHHLAAAANAVSAGESGDLIEVPVAYGGGDGPDLAEVAMFCGLTVEQVIARHMAREYRVFMLGFAPGYAYMGMVDESIAVSRKATPRTRVPGGSVAIAGRQTGIYPRESPGGWQLIGRTALQLFDPSRQRPSLFAPGDRVRFIRAPGSTIHDSAVARGNAVSTGDAGFGDRWLTVLRPGLLTTIQDSGRWGYHDIGVPVAGPMDAIAHRLANALVGNPRDAATLEATVWGPELRFEQPTVVAVTGANFSPTVDDKPLPLNLRQSCHAGAVLRFGERRSGARAYIACDGGISVAPVLGSRATDTLSGLGGIAGRPLAAGDRLPLGRPSGDAKERVLNGPADTANTSPSLTRVGGARLRVILGPQRDLFDDETVAAALNVRLTISPQSNRVGYRLQGLAIRDRPDVARHSGQMISDAAFTGGVQLTPSGDPILLMADRQTTGGYPQIATVITADLPAAGQLAPGDWVEFEPCTRAEAIAALEQQEAWIRAFE